MILQLIVLLYNVVLPCEDKISLRTCKLYFAELTLFRRNKTERKKADYKSAHQTAVK